MRIGFFGAYDPSYPRNLILRRGLTQHGFQIIECRVPTSLGIRQRAQALSRQFMEQADQVDVLWLAEFNNTLAWFTGILARRYNKPLVIDAFTSLYDSAIDDRSTDSRSSLHAIRYWALDWLTVHPGLSRSCIVTDTTAHRDYFVRIFGARSDRFSVVPVGASQEWFETPAQPHHYSGVLVQFYGTFIPLHGIEMIVQAAHYLRRRQNLYFEIIGKGQTYTWIRSLADNLHLGNLYFRDPVSSPELPALAARSELALGIFGVTDKAGRVVPNKVYQTLALGKPLITRRSSALNEAFADGRHVLGVPAGDPVQLAHAIEAFAADTHTRETLASAGRARMEEAFTESAIGKTAVSVIQSLL